MDMKRILQAMDGAATKPVAGASDMSKFLSIIDKNDVEILNEGSNPHKVTLPVQMAMQHYQKPVTEKKILKTSIEKYFLEAEEAINQEKDQKRQLLNQYASTIANRVLMKESISKKKSNLTETAKPGHLVKILQVPKHLDLLPGDAYEVRSSDDKGVTLKHGLGTKYDHVKFPHGTYKVLKAQGVSEGEIERQHGDLKPWAYWHSPERVAQKLYKIHHGKPIGKDEVVHLWKVDGPDRMTKFMLKPDLHAILSNYEAMSDQGPLFKENELEENVLDSFNRHRIIHFLAKKMNWEINYLELATDHELIKWYKAVRAGKDPMKEGQEDRNRSRKMQMATDYEKRAKATKNDIKKQHYEKMAADIRRSIPTSDEKEVSEARQSAQVKLQKAFQREQEKSEASRKRGEEVMAKAKADSEKKQQSENFVPGHSSGFKPVAGPGLQSNEPTEEAVLPTIKPKSPKAIKPKAKTSSCRAGQVQTGMQTKDGKLVPKCSVK